LFARVCGLLLVVFVLFSSFNVQGLTFWGHGGSGLVSWRFWFVVLDDGVFDGDIASRMLFVEWSQDPVVRVVESLGGRVFYRHWLVNAISFEASPDVVGRLRSMGYNVVPSIVLEPLVVESLFKLGGVEALDMIGVDTIGARRLHQLGITGSNVRIAVIDDGVENNHPWLMRGGRSVVAWEVDATGTGEVDYCGKKYNFPLGGLHGTHIAGIIAGQNPKTPGVAPGAVIYDLIAFSYKLDECLFTSWLFVLRAIELALLGPDGTPNTGDEADVINLSLGTIISPWYLAILKEARVVDPVLESLKRVTTMGKFVVVAASNRGGHYTLNYLCAAPGVVCVGSSNQMGTVDRSDDSISWFSSRGPMPWYDIGPTLVAPGERIYSTIPTVLASILGLSEPALALSGTSMAAPHISGAIALLVEHYRRQGRSLTVDMATRLLVHSSTNVWTTEIEGNVAGPHEAGAGLPDVYNAAFTSILVDIEGGYIHSTIALKDRVDLKLTIHNVGDKDVSAYVRIWFDDTFRPPWEGLENVASISPRSVSIPAGGKTTVVISIDVNKLLPGLYGGYVDVIVGGRGYRALISLLVPGKPLVKGLRVVSEIPVVIGRFMSMWAWPDWVMTAFYIDKPLGERAIVRIEVNDICSVPVKAMVFEAGTGYMKSAGYPGFILEKPGLYIVFLEPDITYSMFLCRGIWGNVILEAQLFESTYKLLESKLEDTSRRLASLEERVAGLESKIRSVEHRIAVLEERVSNIESRVSSIESKLASLTLEISTLETKVSKLEEEVAGVKLKVSGLENRVSNIEGRVSGLESRISGVEGRLSSLEVKLSSLISNMSRLEHRLSKVEMGLEAIRSDLESFKTTITSLVSELRGGIERLREDLASTRRSLEELSQKLDLKVRELREAINVSEAKLVKALEEQSSRIEGLSNELGKTRDELDTLKATVASSVRELKTSIERLQGEITMTRRSLEELSRKLDLTSRELREALSTSEAKLVKALEEQRVTINNLSLTLDKLERNLVEVNKTASLKLGKLAERTTRLEEMLETLETTTANLRSSLEKLSNNLEETRKTLETTIKEESSKAREVGERATIIGSIALATSLIAITTITLQTIRRKRA